MLILICARELRLKERSLNNAERKLEDSQSAKERSTIIEEKER
jgi:hypothetical protein